MGREESQKWDLSGRVEGVGLISWVNITDLPLESSCFEETKIFQEEQKTIYALIKQAFDLF